MKGTQTRKASGHLAIGLLALAASAVMAACSTTSAVQSGSPVGARSAATAKAAIAARLAASAAPQPASTLPQLTMPIPPAGQASCGSPPKEAPQPVGGSCQTSPITPVRHPSGPAAISFCGGPAVEGPQPIGTDTRAICGSGFGAAEVVRLVLTGRLGSTSWTVVASAAGSFQSALPATACRYSPGSVVAHGNQGHVSNALAVTNTPCRPGL